MLEQFRQFVFRAHDIDVNQKYNGNLPYSFHLNEVELQAIKYQHLLDTNADVILARMGALGHDLIEDARVTWNDVRNFTNEISRFSFPVVAPNCGERVADIIYACTELRGRNRAERHGKEYFDLLRTDKLATYVKLCDIIANVRFGVFTSSGMVKKYKMEFSHLKEQLYREEFKVMFDDLQGLLEL